MDAASFERVYDSLQEFHAFFAASFGRKQWRDHSGNYLQALLVAGDAAPGAVRARSIAVVAGGYAATQRTGSPFPRETPLHPPRKQDGAATLNPSL